MESNRGKAKLSTLEGLKASKREIQAQHATLGVQISGLEGRISTLEAQLRDYVGGESETSISAQVDIISLKVMRPDGSAEFFRIKKYNPLEKLISAWCNRHSVERGCGVHVVFVYRGRRLEPSQTPELLDMKDGDEMDAFVGVSGGASRDSASCGICVD